jgi:hypothetical protein
MFLCCTCDIGQEEDIEVLPARQPVDVMALTLRDVAVPTASPNTLNPLAALYKGARCIDIRCKPASIVLRSIVAMPITDPIFLYLTSSGADDVEGLVASLEEIAGPRLYRSTSTASIYDTPLRHLMHKIVVLVEAKEMPKALIGIAVPVTNAMRRISDKDLTRATFVSVDYNQNKPSLEGFTPRSR